MAPNQSPQRNQIILSPENFKNFRFKGNNTPCESGATVCLRFSPGKDVPELLYEANSEYIVKEGIKPLSVSPDLWKAGKASVNFLTNRFGNGKTADDKEKVKANYLKMLDIKTDIDMKDLDNIRHVANLKRLLIQAQTRLGRSPPEDTIWENWAKDNLKSIAALVDKETTKVKAGLTPDLKKPVDVATWFWGRFQNEKPKKANLLGEPEPSSHISWSAFLFSNKIGSSPYLTGEEILGDLAVPDEFKLFKTQMKILLDLTIKIWWAIPGSPLREDRTDSDSKFLGSLRFYLPPITEAGLATDKDDKSFDFSTWCPKKDIPKLYLKEPTNLDPLRAAFMLMFLHSASIPRKDCLRMDKSTQPLRVLMGATAYEALESDPRRPEIKYPEARIASGIIRGFKNLVIGKASELLPSNHLLYKQEGNLAHYFAAIGAKISTPTITSLSETLVASEEGAKTEGSTPPPLENTYVSILAPGSLTEAQLLAMKIASPKIFHRRTEKEKQEQKDALPGFCRAEIKLLREEFALTDTEILNISGNKSKKLRGQEPKDKLSLALWALKFAPAVIRIGDLESDSDNESEVDLG